MSECNEKLKSILTYLHTNILKPLGFRKNGQNFRLVRRQGMLSFAYVINFQKSAWNTKEDLRFTVNIGGKMYYGDTDPDSRITDYGYRLGHLAYGFDKWWEIKEDTDIDALRDELAKLLREVAIPKFGL